MYNVPVGGFCLCTKSKAQSEFWVLSSPTVHKVSTLSRQEGWNTGAATGATGADTGASGVVTGAMTMPRVG